MPWWPCVAEKTWSLTVQVKQLERQLAQFIDIAGQGARGGLAKEVVVMRGRISSLHVHLAEVQARLEMAEKGR